MFDQRGFQCRQGLRLKNSGRIQVKHFGAQVWAKGLEGEW